MGTGRERLTAAERAPFHTLVKLVEHELELAHEGHSAELREAIARTGAYLETLPKPAPESARQLVLHAEAMRGRVRIETERLQTRISSSRNTMRRARRIARSYAPPRAGRYSTSA
jgi:hypothetical protein